ncbi:sugar ABC transporter ATP-binding protein [Rubellimicrobium sp. CFH 75288]|uniref:sugar ABC transporter ATP-binding protein n=1 Tax=Rubellimicrobium sp. CFH 75288 TaxID=2697034 RepID=UPI0014129851|nr:sugar ABC transporter ATP-binding protein [Rubellimicrobium sp. CFH 75288]NAZ36358.1 ATP-binding cassette domain-containing protein [Rubellimicrobium sp. CFH 75288]
MMPLFEVEGLRKSFGGVMALRDGRFRLDAGSVHALCGGNGAGKSTFLKIVMGIESRDGGRIRLDGREVRFASPREALAAGVAMVEQELSPVPAMTVAENIFLGREPTRAFGRVDFARMNREAAELLGRLGFHLPPDRPMMDLTVAQVQLVEIAKALSHEARVIIMDEPTSALGEAEAGHLFDAIERLRAQGAGIIYVSHRLSEIFRIADRWTVFRDGCHVAEGSMAEVTRETLIQHIVGRPLAEEFVKENVPGPETMLEVEGLTRERLIRDVSFSARRGEILGIYGLMGSGRTEILECLFGLAPDRKSGRIRLDGREVRIRSPKDAIRAGLALVTEDRKGSGLVLTGSVRSNITLAGLEGLSIGPAMNVRRERAAARRMIEAFSIRTPHDALEVSGLSGGNQQKVVLGKWFLTEPRVLLLDEPTRGVDVGAKREIYRVMSDFAGAGGTVVLVSSETEEVLGMADRIVVIRDGRVAGEMVREAATAEDLVHLAA